VPKAQKEAPPAVSVSKPPEAQKALPSKPGVDKSAERRGAKKSDEQLAREKLKREEEERNR
jgi:hypothetical protein